MTQAPSRPGTKTRALIDLIAQAPDGMTCRELIDATGYKVSTVTSTLTHLLDDGRICTPFLRGRNARAYRLNSFSGPSRRMGRVYYIPGREPGGQGISRKIDSPRPSRARVNARARTDSPTPQPAMQLIAQHPRLVQRFIEIDSSGGRIGRFSWYNSRPVRRVSDKRGAEPATMFGDSFFDWRAESAWAHVFE